MHDNSRRIDIPEAEATNDVISSSLIPKSFMLGGLKINVQFDTNLSSKKKVIGEAHYAKQMIRLDPSIALVQSVEQAFLHELTHWIFYVMNEESLRNNEKIVDLFAHFLYQALTTAEPMVAAADARPADQEA